MNKAEKEYCNRCYLHERCGFVNRGMEDGCTELDAFSLGYEKAMEDVFRILEVNLQNYWSQMIAGPTDFIGVLRMQMEE